MNETAEKTISLFNPLNNDFVYDWYDDKNVVHTIILRSVWTTVLPYDQGIFMAKHLEDEIMNTRGIKKNPELDRQEIHKEIIV